LHQPAQKPVFSRQKETCRPKETPINIPRQTHENAALSPKGRGDRTSDVDALAGSTAIDPAEQAAQHAAGAHLVELIESLL
jgi:hypothetical protein